MSNQSLGDTAAGTAGADNSTSCVALNEMSLSDVLAKMDIGDDKFWGGLNTIWLAFFITYCVIFYAVSLLLSLFCIYFCHDLLFYIVKQAYPLRTLMYLLTTYISWFISSYAHGILIIYSVADDSESTNRILAAVIRNLETLASSCFVSFIVLAFFSHTDVKADEPENTGPKKTDPEKTDSNLYFPLKYAVLSTVVIYLFTAIVMIILSIPIDSEGLVTLAFVVLVVFRSLIFITSVFLVFVGISRKSGSLKTKEQFCLLWNDSKLLVIALPYLLLSYTYFLYTLTTVINNSCIEDVQLYREVWLALNASLRVCEISFSIAFLIKTVKLVEKFNDDSESEKDSDSVSQCSSRRNSLYIFSSVADPVAKPVGSGETNHHSCLEESEDMPAEKYATKKNLPATEIENLLSYAPNLDVEILSESTSLSLETSRLHQSIDSDRFLDAANFSDKTESSSNILDAEVKVIEAQPPVDAEYLVGDVEAEMFDERGGVFHSYKHGVTVIVPAKAISSGTLAELKFAATLISPVPFQSNKTPVSAIFWLCMDSKVKLHRPIQLRLPMMRLGKNTDALQFAKSAHSSQLNVIGDLMEGLEGGKFVDGECNGSIEVDHFCYYCIMYNNLHSSSIPFNSYLLIAMKQSQPSSKDKSWTIDICLVTNLRTCVQYLKNQYNRHDWEFKELTEFSFEDDCEEMEIDLANNDFGSAAKVQLLSDKKLKKTDVDFYQYYDNNLEELKNRMDRREYPPRFKARVTAKHINFFARSKRIIVECSCNAKCSYKGKMSVPCISKGMYGDDSSESDADSNLQRRQLRSSGYASGDDTTEPFDDESKHVSGELKIRQVILLTSEIGNKWYKLGIALDIPLTTMEEFYGKYSENPMKALNRVYRYWLRKENNLNPTWESLVSALQEINEYTVATNVLQYRRPRSQNFDDDSAVFTSDPNDCALKNRVMKYMKLDLLDLHTLIPKLNNCQLLTQHNLYDLKNPLVPPIERANALVYQILPSKGSGAFTLFVKCLQEEKEHMGHQTLAKLFTLPDQVPETPPVQCEDKETILISRETNV